MDSEERDILRGLGLAIVALASAVVTATLVIGLGSILMRGLVAPGASTAENPPHLASIGS